VIDKPHFRPSRTAAALAAVLSALVLLAGCSGSTGPDQAAGVDGGTLRYRLGTDEGCLDPYQQQLRAMLGVSRQVVDSLVYQTQDGHIVPWLAKSWELNADASQYTFHLRDDVTFSDGSVFDAAAVEATMDGLVARGAKALLAAPLLAGYTGTQVVDANTVTIRFDHPNAGFMQAVTTPTLGIASPKTWTVDPGVRCQQSVVGTGPFTFQSYTPRESISLTKRPGYHWAPDSFQDKGPAHLDGIKVSFVSDAAVAIGQLQSGDLDILTDLSGPALQQVGNGTTEVWKQPNPGIPMGLFVNPIGPLQNENVREALSLALDRPTLVHTALSPIDEPATGLLSSVTTGYAPFPQYFVHDAARARSLLDAAGWQPGPDGIRVLNGQRLTVELLNPFGTPLSPILDLAAQQAREVGIDLRIVGVTLAQERERQLAKNFQLRLNASSRGDAGVLTGFFRGLSPQIDQLLDAQGREPDPAKRSALVAQVSELILKGGYDIPIWPLKNPLVWDHNVSGVVFDNTNTPSFSGVSMGASR